MRPGAISTPRLAVITSSSSWASSKTTTSCGGSTGPAAGQVRAVQVGVDHHHVGFRRPLTGPLGETLLAVGTSCRPGALTRRHAHHRPGSGMRLEVELGHVAAVGPARPLDQASDLTGQAVGIHDVPGVAGAGPGGPAPPMCCRTRWRRRRRAAPRPRRGPDQRRLEATAGHLGSPFEAQVVAPALQHGERHRPPQTPGQGGEIFFGQLVLQRFGGRGYHHLAARQHRRD